MTEEQQKAVRDYLKELKLRNRGTSDAGYSLRKYFGYINDTDLNWFRISIREAEEFQIYLVFRTKDDSSTHYSRSSVLLITGFVKSFYDFLKRQNYIFSNPFSEMRKIKGLKSLPRNILKEEEMHKLLNSLKEFWKGEDLFTRKRLYKAHVFCELMYSTGARIHELINLKRRDINFDRGTITIHDTKTKQIREGIINSFCDKVLKIFIDEMREYVLYGKNRADMDLVFGSSSNIRRIINSVLSTECEKLKLPKITSHSIRHAVGYHLLRGGCDIRFIQEILGHKVLANTQIYTKVDKEDLKSVIDEYHPRAIQTRQNDNR